GNEAVDLVNVEQAIVVRVEENPAPGPTTPAHSKLLGHLAERAIAVVQVEPVPVKHLLHDVEDRGAQEEVDVPGRGRRKRGLVNHPARVRLHGGGKKVRVAVVVDIAPGNSHGAPAVDQAGLQRHIFKGSVPAVSVKDVVANIVSHDDVDIAVQ